MALNTEEIYGIRLFSGNKTAVLKEVAVKTRKKLVWIATVNPEFVMKAWKDTDFRQLLQETDLNVTDGIALVWAREVRKSKSEAGRWQQGWRVGRAILRGDYFGQVVAGSSLMDDLSARAEKEKETVFYLGGWEKRAEKTAAYFKEKYPGLVVAWSAGAPGAANEKVLEEIKKAETKVLFVAYGMGNQEQWIKGNLKELDKAGVRLVMGVGRSFDYYSGALKRAPWKWRKMGLEWLYSLIQEPKRWRRQLVLPQFVWIVLTGKS